MLTLANPLGLLAPLGIPAVLAIHFLQRKAVELPVSTLFLLERTHRDAASGRRLERIIPSIPLWMQLLAVLLLAWFLAEPRFQKSGSVQRIAVVLDSSASMGVFKNEAIAQFATTPEARIQKLPATTVLTKQAAHNLAAAAIATLREKLEAMGFQALDTLGLLKSGCGVSPQTVAEASRLQPDSPQVDDFPPQP